MKTTTKFLIALWIISPIISNLDVWFMGKGVIPRLLLCWLELSLLTIGYWLGQREFQQKEHPWGFKK